jgi:hypothetical protein
MLGLAGGRFGDTSSITLVFVDDVTAACGRSAPSGPPSSTNRPTGRPGLRQAVVADPEGQRWELTEHLRDVAPADWGAEQLGSIPG